GRNRTARTAAGAARLARARHAEAEKCPLHHQEPAASRLAHERNGKPLAPVAGLLDDHRLRREEADLREASAGGAGRSRAAAARLSPRDRTRPRREPAPGEL